VIAPIKKTAHSSARFPQHVARLASPRSLLFFVRGQSPSHERARCRRAEEGFLIDDGRRPDDADDDDGDNGDLDWLGWD
jgi:hypothetical protein